ncbi:hypothetical protein DdX_13786 [Ditylenchus destructor]|uniref:Uncharacterized protein n=1 Tax=Ditylenchus destructor TaxID=166010 RepID=A0AAD4R2G0_9BILA|nr:hypothetical protein DdX_13786 [Ditylenchus destructor]
MTLLTRQIQEECPRVEPDSPDETFCKALEGKFDVFAKAYFRHIDDPEVDPCKVAGVCSAKSVGFENLVKLSNVFAQSNKTVACEECNGVVALFDGGLLGPYNTAEKLAKGFQDTCSRPPASEGPVCKALKRKFLVFTKEYFRHREGHPEVAPCKVV